MQERGADRLVVEVKPCEDVSNIERMDNVGVARDAHLPAVRLFRIGIRLSDLIEIGIRLIGAHLVQDHIESDSPLRII